MQRYWIAIGGKLEDDRVLFTNLQELNQIDSSEIISIITNNNRRISGELIDYSELTKNQYDDSLPLETNLNVSTQLHGGIHFDFSIPIEDIKEIRVKEYNYYGLLGFAIGGVIDAIIISEIIYTLKHIPHFDGTLN
jgi:hypothetical protein